MIMPIRYIHGEDVYSDDYFILMPTGYIEWWSYYQDSDERLKMPVLIHEFDPYYEEEWNAFYPYAEPYDE